MNDTTNSNSADSSNTETSSGEFTGKISAYSSLMAAASAGGARRGKSGTPVSLLVAGLSALAAVTLHEPGSKRTRTEDELIALAKQAGHKSMGDIMKWYRENAKTHEVEVIKGGETTAALLLQRIAGKHLAAGQNFSEFVEFASINEDLTADAWNAPENAAFLAILREAGTTFVEYGYGEVDAHAKAEIRTTLETVAAMSRSFFPKAVVKNEGGNSQETETEAA